MLKQNRAHKNSCQRDPQRNLPQAKTRGRFRGKIGLLAQTITCDFCQRNILGAISYWTSTRSSHLTHMYPYWWRATTLIGYPWSLGSGSPFTS